MASATGNLEPMTRPRFGLIRPVCPSTSLRRDLLLGEHASNKQAPGTLSRRGKGAGQMQNGSAAAEGGQFERSSWAAGRSGSLGATCPTADTQQTQETQERPLHSLDGFELQAGTPHRPDGAITPAMPHGFCAAAIGYGDTRWCGEDCLTHDCTVQLEGNGWLWSTCPGGELCVGPMQTVDGRCNAVPMWHFTIVKTEQQHGEPSRRDPMHLPARHLGCTRDKERVQSRPVQGAAGSFC